MSTQHNRDLYDCVLRACIWEATARKAGNVHPHQSFHDLTYSDFIVSAITIAPVFSSATETRVGELVLRSIQATRRVVQSNTNLGIVLLLAPLAVASSSAQLSEALASIIAGLNVQDTDRVYEAIRLASPGGMGEVAEQDVRSKPTLPLAEAMALAQERDLIARQYVNGFHEVLNEGVPLLVRGVQQRGCIEEAIVGTHLELLARHGDSLIARKCTQAVADEASRRASDVLNVGWPESEAGRRTFADLDSWLRADGNRRNPGTTADLVTAAIFAALRTHRINPDGPWSPQR
jgi:triphosphoribosyl-dephospho-CoA synthase